MTASPPPTQDARESGLVKALLGLSENITTLVSQHLALARHELRADALSAAQDVGALLVALFFVMVGYGLLNLAAILFAAWFAGVVGMALTCLTLALINLIGGGLILRGVRAQLATRRYGLHYSGQELQRSKAWARQIPQAQTP